MFFRDLSSIHASVRQEATKYHLYLDMLHVRCVFLTTGMDMTRPRLWGRINGIIEMMEAGVATPYHITKARHIVPRYGPESLFLQNWLIHKAERDQYTARIYYAMRESRKYLKINRGRLARKRARTITYFLRVAIYYLHFLRGYRLTLNQKELLWTVEQIVGVYYEDLTPEENGILLKERLKGERE